MVAVENDIKSLSEASKNNQDLLEAYKSKTEQVVQEESVKIRSEQAAANIATISAVEGAMEARLAWIESSIDVLISQNREKTGQEDPELHKLKKRVSTSRKHLNEAASAARGFLKSFGFFIKAVDSMHRNPVTRWILPLADTIIGYESIFEHGEKMIRTAGETVTASGKYAKEVDIAGKLKGWSPFGAEKQGSPEADGVVNLSREDGMSLLDVDGDSMKQPSLKPTRSQQTATVRDKSTSTLPKANNEIDNRPKVAHSQSDSIWSL